MEERVVLRFLDIFAGAGGISEGFCRAGFSPVAHVEMDIAACFTLKTRTAYKWLKENNREHDYGKYLAGEIDRDTLYSLVPEDILNTVLNYEISEDSLNEIFRRINELLNGNKLDLIVGGPPCQAYSLVGRARDENGMVGDKRNYLYVLYARFLEEYQPKFFVFENVVGLLSARDKDGTLHYVKMKALFEKCGYSVECRKLNAKDYGVLQNRTRVILIGKLGKHENFFPDIPKEITDYTVKSVFQDLPKIKAGSGVYKATATKKTIDKYLFEAKIKDYEYQPVTFHCARTNTENDLLIYKKVVSLWDKEGKRLSYPDLPDDLKTHKNTKSFLDRFKVVADNLPYSQTVVAHISKDGHYFIHPDIKQNRSLSPREIARLQTFPDDYYFESISGKPSRTSAFKQIGNAVPVLLAEKIALALRKNWDSEN